MSEQEKYLKEIRDELKAIREHMDYFSSMAKKEIAEEEKHKENLYQGSAKERVKNELIRAVPGAILLLVVFGAIFIIGRIN